MLDLRVQADLTEFHLEVNTEISLDCATAVIGPNGSGKTTLLRSIAGLLPALGSICLDGESWLDSSNNLIVSAHKRPVGYVSQSPVLLPHLTVENNLKFARWLSKYKRNKESSLDMQHVIESLDLHELLKRKPSALSGGETSRVALAQALICHPSVLLLDEPLASIDFDRKAELLPYLRSILSDYEIPMLFVSHSLAEVAALCEQTVVLRHGRIQSEGSTVDVLQGLEASDVVDDIGVVVHGTVVGHDKEFQLTRIDFCNQHVVVPSTQSTEIDQVVRMRIRALDVALATTKPENISVRNILRGTIQSVEMSTTSPFAQVVVSCGEEAIRAQVTRAAIADLGLNKNMNVFALIKSVTMEL